MDGIAHLPLLRGPFQRDGGGMQEFVHNTTGESFEHATLALVQWSELVQGFVEFLPTNGLSVLPQGDNRGDRVTHR
jgi:hypothetical protein